jgi:hypothetical protein
VSSMPRVRWTGDEALGRVGEQGDGIGNGCARIADEQDPPRQQALQEAGGVGAIALALARCHIGVLGGGVAHERRDVVGQELGGHIDDQGLLAQARDGFQEQPVLQASERLLDTPALLMQIAKEGCGEGLSVQVGDQHPHLAVGCRLAHQPRLRRAGRAAPVAHLIGTGGVQRHAGLGGARAPELPGGTPAAGVVAAHHEADATRIQQGHQPSRRIAAVQRGDVVGQDLGGHIDDQRLLAQARDGLQVQAVLQTFERLLDTPALVLQLAEQGGREGLSVQVGDQHPDLAVGCRLVHESHLGRAGRAAPITHRHWGRSAPRRPRRRPSAGTAGWHPNRWGCRSA